MVRLVRTCSCSILTILVVGFSCTIMEDADLTSAEDFKNLPLKGIVLTQQTTKGTKSISILPLYDSVQNFTDPNTGAKIVRKVGYSASDFGNLKMKLRSNSSGNTEFFAYYKTGNAPYTFGILKGDSIVELYRFRYDGNNRLNKIITIINPVDNQPATVFTNDTLIYTASNVSSIIRRSPYDPSKAATINIQYGGSGSFLSVSNFTYLNFQYQQTQGNCPNNANLETCVGYLAMPTQGGGGSNSTYTMATSLRLDRLVQLRLLDYKFNTGSNRDYDTYYFHPLLLMRDQFSQGVFLSIFYSMDWFVPGPVLNNTNFSQDESVSINYNYGN